MIKLPGLLAVALLAGCGGGEQGGLTADENAELNEAANMLDAAPEALSEVGEYNSFAPDGKEYVNQQKQDYDEHCARSPDC